uniref:Methyltransferase-like protein, related n=1 Tax=Neospora caninum (strain Liverpool) TaxID=572307 RepID=A0A0F7URP7_NEOCL|nr:TPA: Methyltransferase-like protein, related [Neospora caninum Liverpool]
MASLQPPPPAASSSPSFSPAPFPDSMPSPSPAGHIKLSSPARSQPLRLLCWFLCHNDYGDFRFEELEALAEEEGISREELWRGETAFASPVNPKPASSRSAPKLIVSQPPVSALLSPSSSPSPPPPSLCSSPSSPPSPPFPPLPAPPPPSPAAAPFPPDSVSPLQTSNLSPSPCVLPRFPSSAPSPPASPPLPVPPPSPCSSPSFSCMSPSFSCVSPSPGLGPHSASPVTPPCAKASGAHFAYCYLPSEAVAERILKKSILIRAFIEVWAEEQTYPEVLSRMQEPGNVLLFRRYINDERTWAFRVKAFGKSLSVEEQREKMNFFSTLFKGTEKVSLDNPDITLAVAEEWVHATEPGARPAEKPLRIFFGREIASRHADKNAQPWWWPLRLSRRPVLGPTSLDVELAFLMCHQAHIKRGSLVLDPFVGTGSILISASYYGATCIGSDIDIRVLKGYSVAYLNPHLNHPPGAKKDVFRNFKEYGLARPEIVRGDNAAWVWRLPPPAGAEKSARAAGGTSDKREESAPDSPDPPAETDTQGRMRAYLQRSALGGGKPWVDAIVTDPPYGIRAGARQSGHQQKHKRVAERSNEERLTYISPTILYAPQTVVSDLLNLAARLLVDNGRLVFLLPVDLSTAQAELDLLRHEDLELLACSLQPLSGGERESEHACLILRLLLFCLFRLFSTYLVPFHFFICSSVRCLRRASLSVSRPSERLYSV